MPIQPCLLSPSVVVNATRNRSAQASPSVAEANQVLKEVKQWKTRPVCNELFPSSISQVAMEVAHKHSESKPAENLEPKNLAACAPCVKWTSEKTVWCLSCKCLVSKEERIHHLQMAWGACSARALSVTLKASQSTVGLCPGGEEITCG